MNTIHQQYGNKKTVALPPLSPHKLLFVGLIHAVALLVVPILLWKHTFTVSWYSIGLTLIWFILGSTAITGGYHRLFSHHTYSANWLLRLFYVLWGATAFQGSARQWSAQHLDHHRYVDTEKDPYNINFGFWFAHIGWVIRKTNPDYSLVGDIDKDPIARFQHQYYYPIAFIGCFALPAAIAALWGELWAGLLIAGFLRLCVQWHMTFCVNSVAHTWGMQRFSKKNTARGSWWLAFLTWGEMDHNYHHKYPRDFRTGTRWWDFDPAKWFIWLCALLRIAWGLKRSRHA